MTRKIILQPEESEIRDIPLDQIDQNENSRVVYKEHELSELMGSMANDGLLQPVGVRIEGDRYDAVFGNRRILAAKKLGWHSIKAMLVTAETETDRDILNLVENFKRQNTTVAEDGRMFKIMMDRGLTLSELSARIGIPSKRIQMALEIINGLPEDLQKKVVHKVGATNTTKKGKIPASTALKILNTGRRLNMDKEKLRPLFEYAGKDGSTAQDVQRLVPFLEQGYSIPKAITAMEKYRVITLSFTIDIKKAQAFEKKSGRKVHTYIKELIRADGRIPLASVSFESKQNDLFES